MLMAETDRQRYSENIPRAQEVEVAVLSCRSTQVAQPLYCDPKNLYFTILKGCYLTSLTHIIELPEPEAN